MIVSNEVEIWKLANQHCEANFSPTIPVRSISITSDYVSFFLTQDTHIEKWVVDWKITYEGKKYRSPFLQLYKNEGAVDEAGQAKDEAQKAPATSANQYKGTIETVEEEGEEEDGDEK